MSQNEKRSFSDNSPSTVADQTTAKTPNKQITYGNSDDEYCYRCPYCGTSYQNELNTRVHVTRAEDVEHLHHNGLMPETEIEVLDEDGNVVTTISRRPEEIDTSELTLADFPDELTEQHRHILLVAAQNPYEETYTKLAEKVNDRIEDYDIAKPSYSTVRRVVRKYYRPGEQESGSNNQKQGEKTLSELTAKQQAIVIARVVLPDESDVGIADRIECAKSYPTQVFDQANHILNQLDANSSQTEDLVERIRKELTDDDLDELIQRGLLEEIPIDFENDKDSHDSDAEDGRSEVWGSPVDQPNKIRASPDNLIESVDDAETGSTTNQAKLSDSVQSSTDGSSTTENTDKSEPSEQISPGDIQELKDKISFLRETFDQSTQNEKINSGLLVSFAEQIEQRCEAMLQIESQH